METIQAIPLLYRQGSKAREVEAELGVKTWTLGLPSGIAAGFLHPPILLTQNSQNH